MQKILIAAVAANGVIGSGGHLPWHIPAELRHFRIVTTPHAVVFGRFTADAVGALPGRLTIAVSWSEYYRPPEGVLLANSLPAAIRIAEDHGHKRLYIAGGAELYRTALISRMVDSAVISRIDGEFAGDAVFPDDEFGDAGFVRRRSVRPGADMPPWRGGHDFVVERWMSRDYFRG